MLFWCLLVIGRVLPTPALSCKDGELPWRDVFTTTPTLCLDRPSARLHYQWITQWTMSGQRVLLDMWSRPCCSITGIIAPKTDLWICHPGVSQSQSLSCLTSARLKGTRPRAAVSGLVKDQQYCLYLLIVQGGSYWLDISPFMLPKRSRGLTV